MVYLSKEIFDKMVVYAKTELPNEACGLLAGTINETGKHIKKVYYLTNMDYSPHHFSLSTKEQFAAMKDMRANGYMFLGNWHSHPETAPVPSSEDRRLAYDKEASYVILSLRNIKEPILKSFHYIGDVLEEEEMRVKDNYC